jgi:hypothetical protein
MEKVIVTIYRSKRKENTQQEHNGNKENRIVFGEGSLDPLCHWEENYQRHI